MGVFGSSWVVLSALIFIALMAIYFPTVYIRKSNEMIKLLEQIAGKKSA